MPDEYSCFLLSVEKITIDWHLVLLVCPKIVRHLVIIDTVVKLYRFFLKNSRGEYTSKLHTEMLCTVTHRPEQLNYSSQIRGLFVGH